MLNAVLALNDLDTKVFDSPIPGEAPRIYDDHVTVPDAHLLFNGQFQRVGSNDLKIVGEDGQSFFIQDYFASETRAHLMSPQGATLSASVVEALAGPLAPGQHAQAGGQPASTQPVIGRVDALSGSATVVRNGVTVSLNVGDTVRKGDVVQTSGSSSVAIVFTDGSTFSLNANARMVLDEFVYAAGGTGNSALISLVQGTFSFVAGQVAKTGDMKVETPVATMGIRGTAVLVEISANDGQTRFSVMVEPDGTTGAFNLYNKTTGALIGTVSNSQVGWVVTPAGPLQVVAQQVQKTPGELAQELGIVQQIFTIFNNNQQNPFVPTQDRGDNPNDTNPQTAQGGGGSGTPPAGSTTSNNPLVDAINTASNNPSTAPSSATIPLPTNPLPGANPGSPPPAVTVTVSANKPPVAVDDPDGTPGGGNVITPTNPEAPGTDLDPEGGNISVTTAQHVVRDEGGNYVPSGDPVTIDEDGEPIEGTYGTLTLSADGTYTFTPNDAFRALAAGEQATDTFQYTITDPFGLTASAVLTIKLTGENDAPVADDVTLEVNALGNGGFETTPDFDGWTINLQTTGTASTVSSSATINRSGVLFPGDDAVAVLTFDAWVPNAYGTGYGPSITSDLFQGNAGDTFSFTYRLSSGGDQAIGSAYLRDENGNIVETIFNYQNPFNGSTGVQTYTITLEQSGSFMLDFRVGSYDWTGGLYIGATLEIGYAGILQTGVSEDKSFVFAEGNFLSNASDADGDALSLYSVTATSSLGAVVYLNQDGTVTYDPTTAAAIQALAAGETITDTFTFTVQDEHGEVSNEATATVTVQGANDAPVLTGDLSASVDHGDSYQITAEDLSFADPDNIAANIVFTVTNPVNGAVTVGGETVTSFTAAELAAGLVSFTHDGSQSVAASFDISVEDGDEDNSEAVASTFNMAVNPPPNVAPNAGNVTLEVNALGNGGFETTPDFDGWTINLQTSGTYDTVFSSATIDRSGTLIAGDDAVAVLTFGAWVPEPEGTGYGPSITSDLFEGSAGDTFSFTYQLSSGGDWAIGSAYLRDENGNIVEEIFNYQNPFSGSTGVQTYTITLEQSGSFMLDFRVGSFDWTGGQYIGATLEIGYAGILQTGVSEDKSFAFAESNFLSNASDTDGDALSLYSVAATSSLGAVVYLNQDGTVTYDPTTAAAIQALAAGETITDTFTFTVQDEHGEVSNEAIATVTVEGANEAPVIHIEEAGTYDNWGGEESPGSTTLYGLTVTDDDATETDIFHVSITSEHGTLSPANPLSNNEGPGGSQSLSFHATLADINNALSQGVVYIDPEYNENSGLETVTITVTDPDNNSDSINFIFNIFDNPNVELTGTDGKDVLFGTGLNDTFTGRAGKDTFVFGDEGGYTSGRDTILDFTQGEDRIAFYGYADISDLSIELIDNGRNTQVSFGDGNTITLSGAIGLTPNDFIFHPSNVFD